MRRGRAVGLLAALLLLSVPAAALPPPVPARPVAEGGFATPHEPAYAALARMRSPSGLYPREANAAFHYTSDQMMAVLALVERAHAFPSGAAVLRAQALTTWRAMEGAWSPTGFYHVTTAADSLCIHPESNSWALLASWALANATGDAGARRRATDIARTLADAVVPNGARTRDLCPRAAEFPSSQWPFVLWALLEYASESRDSSPRTAAVARLRSELSLRYDGAFSDPSLAHLYLALTNVQYLLVLDLAARLDPALAAHRSSVSAFVQQRILVDEQGWLTARSVERHRESYVSSTDAHPVDQLWTAYALHQERRQAPLTVENAPERILASFVRDHWSPLTGSFTTAGRARDPALNALASLFTIGPSVTSVTPEQPSVQIVVPARRGFTYPPLGAPGSEAFHVLNAWDVRFRLELPQAGSQPALLSGSSLGQAWADHPVAPGYAHVPRIVPIGRNEPVQPQVVAGRVPLFTFVTATGPTIDYRATLHSPIVANQSDVGRSVKAFLLNLAPNPMTVGQLRIDLAMSDVDVTQVRVNDFEVPRFQYEVSIVAATPALPQPHVRIELRNVVLEASSPNEVLVFYNDNVRPELHDLRVTRDEAGLEQVRVGEGRDPYYKLGPNGQAFVFVRASDNAMLRDVQLVLETAPRVTVPLNVTNRPGWYSAALRPGLLPRDVPVQFQVQAVDEHDNLVAAPAEDPRLLKAETSFFREGNAILFVFSAVLFATATVIYVKMGRRS